MIPSVYKKFRTNVRNFFVYFNIQYNSYDVTKIIPVDLTIRESFSIFYFIKSQSVMQRFFRKSATCYYIS